MLGGVGSIGTLSARRRVIAAAAGGGGGGGGAGVSRSGTSDSNHVHTMSSLNSMFMIPGIVYISNTPGGSAVNDNDGDYSIKDINFTSGSNASHTFYLSIKGKPNNAIFHNDVAVGAIQIHSSSAVVFAGGAEDLSVFSTSTNTSNENPTGETYSSITTSGAKWRIGTATASNQTGATDSISTTFQNTSNPLPEAGNGIISQALNTDYLFPETSSPFTTNEFIHLKFTVSLATNAAHKFVLAYNFGTAFGDTTHEDDNLGLFIEN